MREENLKFYMVPGYHPTLNSPRHPRYCVDSVLIDQKLIAIFANWIERKTVKCIRTIPYKFNLLYRASRDGNTATAFHGRCDNRGATIVVAKIANSEQIVGGYNPLFWDSSYNYKSTNDSFLFSFTDRNNLKSAKVGYCNNNQYAVYCHPNHGPAFGGGYDLYYNNNDTWYSNHPHSYNPKVDIPTNFNAWDYEVFQVIKK